MCDKVYFAKSSLAGHVRKIHIGFEVKCKYCGKVYKAHSSLASHVKRNHPNGVKIEYNSGELIFFFCCIKQNLHQIDEI